jgi:spectinomycin phosphotransferase
MREQPNISSEDLRGCLQEHYAISASEIEFLPVGLDTRAALFRITDIDGTHHLLKARASAFYEACYLVPRYLSDGGIAAVVAPLRTQGDALWAQMGEWHVAVYPFIQGETGWDPDMTDAQWQAVGAAVNLMHHIPLPSGGIPSLRREAFDPMGYRQRIAAITAHLASHATGSAAERTLHAGWLAHQATIQEGMATMVQLADVLNARPLSHVICHADLHENNIIRTPDGQVFIIDWDDVMLAPKERDFLFTGDPPFANGDPIPAFFQGYGPAEIDWQALAYYRWERVITDVIECGQIVLFRDDLGEATKAGEAHLFHQIFAPGSSVDVARSVGGR